MSSDLILVAIAMFTWGIGESAYFYFQPLYLEQLGASPVVIGAILGGVGVSFTVAHIPAGYLADRFGRRALMWAAWIMGMAAAWVMALATSLPMFTAGIMLYGITGFVIAPLNSYVTAARGKWTIERAITAISAAYNAGSICGPLIGGWIGDRFGLGKIYLFAGLVFIASTIVIFFIRSQPVEKRESSALKGRSANPEFLRFLPVFFLAIFSMYLGQPLASNFLQHEHALSISAIGTLGAIGSLGTVLLSLGLGSLPATTGFILGQSAAGLFSLFLWMGTGFPWFAAAYFSLGGWRAARTMAIAHIGDLVQAQNMGLAYGIAETVGSAALILAPPLAGYIFEQNPIGMYQAGVVLVGASVVVSLFYARSQRNRPDELTI